MRPRCLSCCWCYLRVKLLSSAVLRIPMGPFIKGSDQNTFRMAFHAIVVTVFTACIEIIVILPEITSAPSNLHPPKLGASHQVYPAGGLLFQASLLVNSSVFTNKVISYFFS